MPVVDLRLPRQTFPRPTRDATLLLAGTFATSLPLGYLLVILPIYLKRVGLEPTLIGVLYTISGLASALLLAVSGLLADRLGRKPFLIVGSFLPVVAYGIFAATTDQTWLIAASAIGGVGLAGGIAGALTGASFDALLAEKSDAETRTTLFTVASALWTLALGAGALLAGLPEWSRAAFGLGEIESYRPVFWLAIALTIVGGVVLLPVREERRLDGAERPGWLPRRSRGTILRVALTNGLLGLGLGVVVQLLPLWFHLAHGVDEASLGPWYGASELASLIALATVPWLTARLGGVRTVAFTQLAAAGLLLLMPIVPEWRVAAVLYGLRNVMMNMAWPAQQATVMSLVAPQERAAAAGFGFAVWGLANSIGPTLNGALLQAGAFTLPFVAGALGYGLAGALFLLFFGRARAFAPAEPASGWEQTGRAP